MGILQVSPSAFEILFFSLISAIYLFNGYTFRYIRPLSLLIATTIFSIISYDLIPSSPYELFNQLAILPLLIIVLIATLVTYTLSKWAKPAVPFVIGIFSSLSLGYIVSTLFFTQHLLLSTAAVTTIEVVLILLLLKFWKNYFLIILTTLLGAFVLSTLFASFYYFSLPVHIILFIVLLIGGLITQMSGEKKRGEKQHDE